MLVEADEERGQAEEGLHLLAEALVMFTDGGRTCGNLSCMKSRELLLRHHVRDLPEAESCFRQALEIARHRRPVSAVQQQGKRDKAHELLAPIHAGSPKAL